jgi:hypothetical protein
LLDLLKTFYEAVGAPAHPRIWLAIVFLVSGASVSALWWAIGKQYEEEHSAPTIKVALHEAKPVEPRPSGGESPLSPAPPPVVPQLASNQSEPPWPPLRITLSDGSICTVSLSVQIQISKENAPKVVAELGSADKIRDFLRPVVEDAVLTTVSGKSFQQISKDMTSISGQIQKKVEPRAESVGITVRAVYITAFSRVSG